MTRVCHLRALRLANIRHHYYCHWCRIYIRPRPAWILFTVGSWWWWPCQRADGSLSCVSHINSPRQCRVRRSISHEYSSKIITQCRSSFHHYFVWNEFSYARHSITSSTTQYTSSLIDISSAPSFSTLRSIVCPDEPDWSRLLFVMHLYSSSLIGQLI